MAEWAAVQRVELRRVGEGVFAQPIDVLVAAGREVFEVGFVNGVALGL